MALIMGYLLISLGNMQLAGLPTIGGAVLALLVALTSLLFNRARAYPTGVVQRRSLLTAELAFRATVLVSLGCGIAAVIYSFLPHFGYAPTPMSQFPNRVLPLVLAFVPVFPIMLGAMLFLQALRGIMPTLFVRLRATDVRNASSQRKGK
jgi:hypothetical protein